MSRFKLQALFVASLAVGVLHGGPVLVTSPGGLAVDTTVSWLQLGPDGTAIGSSFTATPTGALTGVNSVGGSLNASGSQLSVDCTASPCSWGPVASGFTAGDTLIWTLSNGPLGVTFPAVFGAGLWLQADTAGQYTAQITANSTVLTETSNSSGDPIFIGVLDSSADITGISLTLTSVGFGGSLQDFAVDTLMLQAEQTETGGTPEPASAILLATGLAAFAWRKRVSKVARAAFRARTGMSALLACALAMGVCASAFGQPFRVLNDNQAVRTLNASRTAQLNPLFTGSPLPIFLYSVVGADGNTYQGEMVGRSPFANGKTTTTVSVVLIPLIVKTLNGGNTFISDPTTADAGCLGTPTTNTAIGLTQASAELNQPPSPFIINGVTVGGFNFADAHLRAEFWGLGQPALGNAFHLNLPHTTAATQTIDATGQSTFNAITAGYGGTHCGANTGLTNNRGALGILNINYLDPLLQGIITTLGLTHNELPLFVLYRAVISDGNAGDPAHTCCILGYHGATNYTATGDPGQTYGIFEFDTGDAFPGVANTSVMAHEVSEWVNDPGGSDPTPVWSSGQSALCTTPPVDGGPGQNNLEVGDPLSGISNDHFITMSNGFNYRMQELVYFSWFYSADHTLPPMGASATCLTTTGNSGCLSTNGTFKGPARYCSASPVNTGGTYPN